MKKHYPPWWKRIARTGLVALLFFLFPLTISATPPTAIFGLEESIQRAFKESPALKAAQEGIGGAEFRKKQALTGFLPKLSTQYGYSYLDKVPFAKIPAQDYGLIQIPATTMSLGTQNNYAFWLAVEQPVFTGLALTRTYELAGLGLDVSRIKFEQEKVSLAYKVKEAYLSILRGRKICLVAQQTVEQITDHLRVAQEFYQVGIIPLNDLLKSEVQLADARQNLVRSENSLALAKSNFNSLLRFPLEKNIEIQDILKYQPYSQTLEDCQAAAFRLRLEIKEIETQIEMAQKHIQLAQSEYYPQVSVQGRYKKQGDTASVSGNPYVESDNWEVGAVLKWNLWEWGRTNFLEQEKIKQREQIKATLIQIKDLIRLEVKEAYLYLEEGEKNIGVAEKSIQQAEENFRISQVRYREQVATSLEVLDAQTLLAQAKNNYYQALYAFNLANARLMKAMGNW